MRTKQQKYTDQLPATPCTPQMRGELWKMAQEKGESMAEIQRQAVEFFLNRFATDAIKSENKTIKELSR